MATDDKYDRQLRLWGPHGQRSLMDSHILLINADGCGTETLKNLVLPGVGKFTILDGNLVTEKDCGSNFFVTDYDIGKSRAEVACSLLSELNPDVQGQFRFCGISTAIEEDSVISYFTQFSLIIASNVEETQLLRISRIADALNIPLAAVRAYGLIGYCRLQFKNHEMIETKPSPDLPDLRIANPFEELLLYCSRTLTTKCSICPTGQSHNEEDFQHAEHCKLPFVVLLVRAVVRWKASHENKLPQNSAERGDFHLLLEKDVPGAHVGHENFSEALQETFLALRDRTIPDPILDSPPFNPTATPITAFRVLTAATKMFIEQSSGIPPLNGSLPDMATTTDLFMQLQEVYAAKAKQDRSKLMGLIDSLRHSATEVGTAFPHIDSDLIDRFCKNIYNLRALSTSTLADERLDLPVQAINDAVADAFEQDKKQTPILWYLSLLAADRFFSSTGRYPGTGQTDVDIERDSEAVWLFLQAIRDQLSPVGVSASENMDEEYTPDTARDLLTKDHALEIVRVGACELHNIAAFIGGVAAQEIVKLITRQYVPMNNSYVYNGITGVGATYEL